MALFMVDMESEIAPQNASPPPPSLSQVPLEVWSMIDGRRQKRMVDLTLSDANCLVPAFPKGPPEYFIVGGLVRGGRIISWMSHGDV